jgi:hypothetical protein
MIILDIVAASEILEIPRAEAVRKRNLTQRPTSVPRVCRLSHPPVFRSHAHPDTEPLRLLHLLAVEIHEDRVAIDHLPRAHVVSFDAKVRQLPIRDADYAAVRRRGKCHCLAGVRRHVHGGQDNCRQFDGGAAACGSAAGSACCSACGSACGTVCCSTPSSAGSGSACGAASASGGRHRGFVANSQYSASINGPLSISFRVMAQPNSWSHRFTITRQPLSAVDKPALEST